MQQTVVVNWPLFENLSANISFIFITLIQDGVNELFFFSFGFNKLPLNKNWQK